MKQRDSLILSGRIVLFKPTAEESGLRVGHPVFFVETGTASTLFEEPTYFVYCHYVTRRGTLSLHTWAAAAQALQVWFQYLQAKGLDWREAHASDRIEFRDDFLTAYSSRTGEVYSPSTVASRMIIVREFYIFARKNFDYHGDIGLSADEDTREADDPDLPRFWPNERVSPFTVKSLRLVINYAGPRASESKNGKKQKSCRNRLIFDLGWVVGLRVSEIRNLTTLQFLSLTPDFDYPNVDQQLTILRKGAKVCVVAIPNWLIVDVLAYIDGERNSTILAARIDSKKTSSRLFLGELGSNTQGRPLSINGMQKMVERICFAVGLVEVYEYMDVEKGETLVKKRSKHNVHDLRHTYAVLTYHTELENGNPEPWKKIQSQLGHEHMQTTIDYYLKHVALFNESAGLRSVRSKLGL